MKYNSRKQEAFFRPNRIRVVKRKRGGGYGALSSSWTDYDIQIVNVVTEEVVTRWCSHSCERMLGHWQDDKSTYRNCKRWTMGRKARAIKVAQRAAQAGDLPFSASKAVLDEIDLLKPRRGCSVCQAVERRERQFVCDGCLKLLIIGKAAVEADEQQWCGVDVPNLIPVSMMASKHQDRRGLTDRFLNVFGRVFGFAIEPRTRKRKKFFEIGVKRPRRRWSMDYRFFQLSIARAKLLQELYDLINELAQSAYDSGLQDGEGFIRRLADGEINVKTLQDREVRKEKKDV